MNVIRYSIGTSRFTSSGRSFRKIFPTTSTRLSTATANKTLTSNSRLINRSSSFISPRDVITKVPETQRCPYQNLDNLVTSTHDERRYVRCRDHQGTTGRYHSR